MEFSPQKKAVTLKESIKADIEAKVAFAKNHPIRDEIFEDLRLEAIKIYNKKTPTKEETSRLKEIEKQFTDATIFTPSLYELKVILETLGCEKEYVNDTLDHENAHGNRTTALKAHHYGYTILLTFDEKTGEYIVNPQSARHIPEEWSNWRKNRVEIAISRAPQDYGNSLSPKDEIDLKHLLLERKRLRTKNK